MDRIAEIETRKGEKSQFFRVSQELIDIQKGDLCIVEFTQGTVDYGKVYDFIEGKTLLKPTISGKVLRKVTENDIKNIRENREKILECINICKEKIRTYNLPMKLIDAEYSFDRTKITFYYWSESRIDFRNLVKELAKIFNCRIEMRQIGLRDEAKIKGGYGICGYPLCCAQFLRRFDSITMRMVKNQNLPMDITKITGQCARLLCCLGYEEDLYKKELAKK
ncbi:MAG: stage 0 sporulation family protein [Candidatus Omnitrophica bacterium]|nr:stage 0 sporulation family protein [Candidatus Omnitrophota bacterium]MCM8776874.1 stage 0 sporulation family protein [Candidatus Omnitrophota bacterium]